MKPQFIEQDESPSPQSLKENFQKKFKKGKRGREKKRNEEVGEESIKNVLRQHKRS
jgi:hypothetical protein